MIALINTNDITTNDTGSSVSVVGRSISVIEVKLVLVRVMKIACMFM